MTTEEVIERVRKLLRMTEGRGASTTEAEAAAEIARKMLDEHGLTLEQVEALKNDPTAVKWVDVAHSYKRPPVWCKALLLSIAQGFDCRLVGYRDYMAIVGLAQDTAVALCLYGVIGPELVRAAQRSADDNAGPRHHRTRYVNAFIIGAARRIGQRLQSNRKSARPGLIEAKDRLIEPHLAQGQRRFRSECRSAAGNWHGTQYGDQVCLRTDVLPEGRPTNNVVPAISHN